MKKYLVIGLVIVSLMMTTVYALNSNDDKNNIVKNQIAYHENCPYHNENENCPYYDKTTDTYNYPNSNQENCSHNNGNGNGYGRHNRHHHNH